jgi:hypothetical protein
MRTFFLLVLSATASLVVGATSSTEVRAKVEVLRVPDGGIQPEIAVDSAGVAHMVYLAGEAGAANVFYVRTTDGGTTFTPAVRVNSQDGSAIATGTIRGAHVAVARSGRVHVAWNGSDRAVPKPPLNLKTQRAGMPMLYARSNATGTAFEPQRNLMTKTTSRSWRRTVVPRLLKASSGFSFVCGSNFITSLAEAQSCNHIRSIKRPLSPSHTSRAWSQSW